MITSAWHALHAHAPKILSFKAWTILSPTFMTYAKFKRKNAKNQAKWTKKKTARMTRIRAVTSKISDGIASQAEAA